MPKFGVLNIESTQKQIREIFLNRIIQAKGLSKAAALISGILMPTPSAVMKAMGAAVGSGLAREKAVLEIWWR